MKPSVLAGILGAGVPVLPAGAVGAWYADQYDATANAIPNSLDSRPLSRARNRFPRRRFLGMSSQNPYSRSGCTVVDNAAVSPDGRMEASTVTSTDATALGLYFDQGAQAAGTYTICVSYKQNGGALNAFKIKIFNNAFASPTYTASGSWQRAAFTFTAASSWSGIVQFVSSIDGTTGYDVTICDFQIFAGSSDLNTTWASQSPLDTHIYFGKHVGDTNVTVSGGGFEINGNADYGLLQFPDAVTLTNFALLSCFARQSSGGSTLFGVFSTIDAGTAVLGVQAETLKAGFSVRGVTPLVNRALGTVVVPKNGAYGLWASRMNADGTADVWSDDSPFYFQRTPTYSPTAADVKDLLVGCVFHPGNTSGYKFNSLVLYPSSAVPSSSGMRNALSILRTRAALSSITPAKQSRYLLVNGDSISARSTSYATLFVANASPEVTGVNQAVNGYALSNWTPQESYLADVIPTNKAGRVYIYSLLPGANDYLTYTVPADFAVALAAHIDAVRSSGWDKIVLGTTLPRDANATFNTWRNALNVILRTWVGGRVDALADFAADSIMGPDNSRATNPTYWEDDTHPNTTGHTRLELVYRAAVNSV